MGDQQIKRISRFYTMAAILVIVFIAINMIVENFVYVRSRNIYENNTASVQTMTEIKDKLASVNERVMLMVAGMADEDTLVQINADFGDIEALRNEYISGSSMNAMENRRFLQANYAIQAYHRKLDSVGQQLITASFDTAHSIFKQELDPLRKCAMEMLDATIELGTEKKATDVHNGSLIHGVAQMILIIGTLIGVGVIYLVGRAQVNDAIAMQLKQEELDETSDRLEASRQKLLDSAHTNILTGMRNRYALEKYLSGIVGKKQFYISVYDMDHFRQINDQYGYEYGDEYLISVSDRLKTRYGDSVELFNIYGDEFCAIFMDENNDMKIKTIAEQIRQSIASNTQVAGMMLSSGVSASLYHVLPSERADVGALLRKIDSAMHAAKNDGGNRMYYV
ncbi:MAG: GGDEF domain-containing protein [Oscillospiraceae bacterium]|nr:GGDEF domain-containing protein [Oscillospiraceae bacterium]